MFGIERAGAGEKAVVKKCPCGAGDRIAPSQEYQRRTHRIQEYPPKFGCFGPMYSPAIISDATVTIFVSPSIELGCRSGMLGFWIREGFIDERCSSSLPDCRTTNA